VTRLHPEDETLEVFADALRISVMRQQLSPQLIEVLDLLKMPHHDRRARATEGEWKVVDRVAARLAEARGGAIPRPRAGSSGTAGDGYRATASPGGSP
jgi:hypothetical protein